MKNSDRRGATIGTPILAGTILLSFLLFLWIASEVIEGSREFDDAVLWALRVGHDPLVPIGPAWLTNFLRFVTAIGEAAVLLMVATVVAIGLARRGRTKAAAVLLVTSFGSAAICFSVKALFDRARPDVAFRLIGETGASFPSAHAMIGLSVAGIIALLLSESGRARRNRLALCCAASITAALFGISRIYLGVHFATDVLAGWSLGLAWLLSVWLVATALDWTRN